MTDPLWRRAPWVLTAYRGAGVGLMLAALVLAAVASSGPAFVAAAGDAALAQELTRRSPNTLGVSLTTSATADPELLLAADRAVTEGLATVPALQPPALTVTSDRRVGYPPILVGEGLERSEVWLASRTGATDALVPVNDDGVAVTGEAGPVRGAWIPQPLAAALDVTVGDYLVLSREEKSTAVPIAGLYRPPRADDAAGYWTSVTSQLTSRFTVNPRLSDGLRVLLPIPVFMTPAEVARTTAVLGGRLDVTWEAPLETSGMSLDGATRALADYASLDAELANPGSAVAQAVSDMHGDRTVISPRTTLKDAVTAAQTTEDVLRPSVQALTLMGTILGLALVAAAGVALVRRRSVETRLLETQGVGLGTRALRAGLETCPALIVGGALGWAAGLLLVTVVPPVLPLPQATARDSALTAAWAIAGALVVLMASVAWVEGRLGELVPQRVRAAPVPWELALVVLAAVAGYELISSPAPPPGGTDLLTLAFPLLLLAGTAALGARALSALSALPAGRLREWPLPVYLAARRVAGGAQATRVLVAVIAVATGMAVYGTVLVTSTRASLAEKAVTINGAPTNAALDLGLGFECMSDAPAATWQFRVRPEQAASICQAWDPALADPVRPVDVLIQPAGLDPHLLPTDAAAVSLVHVRPRPAKDRTTLLLVDPASYAAITGADDVAAIIAAEGSPGSQSIPAATAGTPRGDPLPASVTVELAGTLVRLDVAPALRSVPGMAEDGPTLVVDASRFLAAAAPQVYGDTTRLRELFDNAVWSTRGPASLDATLLELGTPSQGTTTALEILDRADFRAQNWSLAYLQVLALTATGLAVAALLLNLAERQRGRLVAAALIRRMGASRRAMTLSLVIELVTLLLLASGFGIVIGVLAGAIVATGVDPLNGAAPPRGLVFPAAFPWLLLGVAGVIGIASAVVLARNAERADVAELMRLAD